MSNARYRVVHITPYMPPVVGGISTYVSGLTATLADRGVEVIVMAREGGEAPGVMVGPHRIPEFIRWCRRNLRTMGATAVHAHGHWYCLAGALSRTRRPIVRPLVFTLHSSPIFRSHLRARLFRKLISRADIVTFVSEESRGKFQRVFGLPPQSEVIYPGVKRETTGIDQPTVTFPLPKSSFRVCAISLLSWPEKVDGIRLLLDAIAELSEEIEDVDLSIVGDGEYRTELETQVARLGIGKHVRFLGILPDPGPILMQADVLCHISFKDSFAQVVLEALSHEVPVLLNEGILDELHSLSPDTGVIRTAPDAHSLKLALAELAGNPERRRRLGKAGKEFVEKTFLWSSQVERFLEVYGIT